MIDSVTAVQYTGYFQKLVRDSYEAGKVNPDNEEARVQGILEAERKRVLPVSNVRGKVIRRQILEKNVKEKRIEFRELGEKVDIIV